MNSQKKLFSIVCFLITVSTFSQSSGQEGQNENTSALFQEKTMLPIRLIYSNKEVRRKTNDSVYLNVSLNYKSAKDVWVNVPAKIRARGNFRLKSCYFVPIKLKINEKGARNTLFQGNKKLKMVLPCYIHSEGDDDIVKEYIAYQLYELVSPYHFKTRMLEVQLTEPRKKNDRQHLKKGFFIEDKKKIANRHGARVFKRNAHPLVQDDVASLRNDLFQYMIGNTDFSTRFQHNEKLFFIDNKIIPVPYDFDMSGLCDTHYSVVSQIRNVTLPIQDVTDRYYRGYDRDENLIIQVRDEFLGKEDEFMAVLKEHKHLFTDTKEYLKCWKFLSGFFEILSNEAKFKKEILDRGRMDN